MILGVRVLLIALLLFGSTGSALCQVLCARPAHPQATALGGVAMPGHAGCHDRGAPSPEPLSERSDGSCGGACCTTLALATADSNSGPDSVSAAPPTPTGIDLVEAHAGSDLLPEPSSPRRLESPFQFRNPPLLI